MLLPLGFVDVHPNRGQWHPASPPPDTDAWNIEVLLASGETTDAAWSGRFWLGHGEMHPIAWRKVESNAALV